MKYFIFVFIINDELILELQVWWWVMRIYGVGHVYLYVHILINVFLAIRVVDSHWDLEHEILKLESDFNI